MLLLGVRFGRSEVQRNADNEAIETDDETTGRTTVENYRLHCLPSTCR